MIISLRKQHPLYQSWKGMRARCNSRGNSSYGFYGAKGIRICKRWDDFWVFVKDMGERPIGFTIDRINGSGNYEPSNCRWVSRAEQSRNRKTTVLNKEKVKTIRYLRTIGYSLKNLSIRYSISETHCDNICKNRKWKEESGYE